MDELQTLLTDIRQVEQTLDSYEATLFAYQQQVCQQEQEVNRLRGIREGLQSRALEILMEKALVAGG